jgi:hypothetical protein
LTPLGPGTTLAETRPRPCASLLDSPFAVDTPSARRANPVQEACGPPRSAAGETSLREGCCRVRPPRSSGLRQSRGSRIRIGAVDRAAARRRGSDRSVRATRRRAPPLRRSRHDSSERRGRGRRAHRVGGVREPGGAGVADHALLAESRSADCFVGTGVRQLAAARRESAPSLRDLRERRSRPLVGLPRAASGNRVHPPRVVAVEPRPMISARHALGLGVLNRCQPIRNLSPFRRLPGFGCLRGGAVGRPSHPVANRLAPRGRFRGRRRTRLRCRRIRGRRGRVPGRRGR